jgi:hypothetical protein
MLAVTSSTKGKASLAPEKRHSLKRTRIAHPAGQRQAELRSFSWFASAT